MMQSLAGEVNTALSPRHHGYAMCFSRSSCRSQLAIWFQPANVWLWLGSPTFARELRLASHAKVVHRSGDLSAEARSAEVDC